MRILHVISSIDPRAGGTTAALTGMAESQRHAGLDVSAVATHAADFNRGTVDELQRKGVEVHLIGPARTSLNWHTRVPSVLRSLVAETEIVHIHALWEEIQHREVRVAHSSACSTSSRRTECSTPGRSAANPSPPTR